MNSNVVSLKEWKEKKKLEKILKEIRDEQRRREYDKTITRR